MGMAYTRTMDVKLTADPIRKIYFTVKCKGNGWYKKLAII
jgi:hypothetical protein